MINNSEEPIVSIVVPVYNLADFIAETLDSILGQSYQSIEVLVVDDGSSDSTRDIVLGFAKKDRRVQLLENTQTKGVSGARNTAIQAATGDWIAFLDGDDLWASDSLEERMTCLEQYPNADFISCDYARFVDDIEDAEESNARVNPDFELKGSGMKMGGGSKPFGIDSESVPETLRMIEESDASFVGFHIYTGSQNLNADHIVKAQNLTLELASQLTKKNRACC